MMDPRGLAPAASAWINSTLAPSLRSDREALAQRAHDSRRKKRPPRRRECLMYTGVQGKPPCNAGGAAYDCDPGLANRASIASVTGGGGGGGGG